MYFEHRRLCKNVTSKRNPLPSPHKTGKQEMIAWHDTSRCSNCRPGLHTRLSYWTPLSSSEGQFQEPHTTLQWSITKIKYWEGLGIHLFPIVNSDEKQRIYSKYSTLQKKEKATVGFPLSGGLPPFPADEHKYMSSQQQSSTGKPEIRPQ